MQQLKDWLFTVWGVSLAVCFAAMAFGAVGHAQSPMIGIGQYSCGRFIASIGKQPPGHMGTMSTRDGNFVSENAEYTQWLLGFLSGFNAAHAGEREQQVTGSDPAGMDLFMRNWCNQHPTQSVFEGALALINEMRSNR